LDEDDSDHALVPRIGSHRLIISQNRSRGETLRTESSRLLVARPIVCWATSLANPMR